MPSGLTSAARAHIEAWDNEPTTEQVTVLTGSTTRQRTYDLDFVHPLGVVGEALALALCPMDAHWVKLRFVAQDGVPPPDRARWRAVRRCTLACARASLASTDCEAASPVCSLCGTSAQDKAHPVNTDSADCTDTQTSP